MPLQSETNDGNRRAARRWLAVSLGLLALVFAVPLILPFAIPIELKLGSRWLRLEAGAIPAVQQTWVAPGPGYTSVIGQNTLVMSLHTADPMKPAFITSGDYHWWWYRAAGVMYSIEIFKGERYPHGLTLNGGKN